MIIRQCHYLERRQPPRSHEFLKLFQPSIGTRLIGYLQVESRIRGIGVTNQGWFCRDKRGAIWSRRRVRLIYELAVVPVGDPRTLREIPQVPARRLRHIVIRDFVTIGYLVAVGPSP